MDRAAAAAVQSSPFSGPSKPPARRATVTDLRDRGLRPSPPEKKGGKTEPRAGAEQDHGGALATPPRGGLTHGSGGAPPSESTAEAVTRGCGTRAARQRARGAPPSAAAAAGAAARPAPPRRSPPRGGAARVGAGGRRRVDGGERREARRARAAAAGGQSPSPRRRRRDHAPHERTNSETRSSESGVGRPRAAPSSSASRACENGAVCASSSIAAWPCAW